MAAHDSTNFRALSCGNGDIYGTKIPDDPDGVPEVPGYRNYRFYCDESGIHGATFVGFGALIMPHERRGDFTGLLGKLRDEHGFHHEMKWTKVSSRNIDFCEAVVREFFNRNWLLFNCFIVERAYVDMNFHANAEQATMKHFGLFVQKRIAVLNAGAKTKKYHVIVDPLPSRYKKADEAMHAIANHTLKRDIGSPLITKLVTRDSRETDGIQLADLLLGATLAPWQGDATSPAKLRLSALVAKHLGWNDTVSDTRPHEMKFNIWHFKARADGRRIKTREVTLLKPCRIFVTRK